MNIDEQYKVLSELDREIARILQRRAGGVDAAVADALSVLETIEAEIRFRVASVHAWANLRGRWQL